MNGRKHRHHCGTQCTIKPRSPHPCGKPTWSSAYNHVCLPWKITYKKMTGAMSLCGHRMFQLTQLSPALGNWTKPIASHSAWTYGKILGRHCVVPAGYSWPVARGYGEKLTAENRRTSRLLLNLRPNYFFYKSPFWVAMSWIMRRSCTFLYSAERIPAPISPIYGYRRHNKYKLTCLGKRHTLLMPKGRSPKP